MDRLTLILMVIFVIISIVLGTIGFIFIRNLVLSWEYTQLPGVPISSGISNSNDPATLPTGEVNNQSIQAPELAISETWDGGSRINLLLMALDFRDWEAGETPRTDSMILLTVDPVTKTAGMLSIPRDMWVNIPGYDYGKINTAYYLGETYKVPGGGPALAAETVERFLGVPIDYYAQIDFVSFIMLIDEIGGIKITIEEPITIYPIEFPSLDGSRKVTLEPGRYRLSGNFVLAYARERHTSGGDFDRAKRQQQVILAVRDEIMNFNRLPELVAKAPTLYEELSSGIRTNLNLTQIIQLAALAPDIQFENIKHGVISPDMVTSAMTPDGLSILIPIPDEIRLLRDQIFTATGPLGPAAVSNDNILLVQQEQARIAFQNGTSEAGLANRTGDYFKSAGLNIVQVTNADQVYSGTTMIIHNGVPYTISYLTQLMSIPVARTINQFDPNSPVDVTIILGDDWLQNNPMPNN